MSTLKVLQLKTIEPGSPADSAGLKVCDLLLSYDGVTPDSIHQFRDATLPGDGADVEILFVRAGNKHSCIAKRGNPGITFSIDEVDIELIPAASPSFEVTEVETPGVATTPPFDPPVQATHSYGEKPKSDILDGTSGFVIFWGCLIGYGCFIAYLEGITDGLGGKVFGYTVLAGVIAWLALFIFKDGKDGAGDQVFKIIAFAVFIVIAIAIISLFSGGGGGAYRVGDW